MPKVNKKIDLAAEADASTGESKVKIITEEKLMELCPKNFLTAFKKAKTHGQRVDFLKKLDDSRKEAAKIVDAMESFESSLKQWFIQELPTFTATGVAGKLARVQLVDKRRVHVKDWDAFYAWVRKNNAFEFFERKVKLSSAEDRWKNNKQVPGIEPFDYKSVSLTKVSK